MHHYHNRAAPEAFLFAAADDVLRRRSLHDSIEAMRHVCRRSRRHDLRDTARGYCRVRIERRVPLARRYFRSAP